VFYFSILSLQHVNNVLLLIVLLQNYIYMHTVRGCDSEVLMLPMIRYYCDCVFCNVCYYQSTNLL